MAWSATVQISRDDEGWFHVYCPTVGDSAAEAKAGAAYILNTLASDRWAVIRHEPSAESETDFDTKIEHHKGFVRFSFRDGPGEWHYQDKSYEHAIQYVGIGAQPTEKPKQEQQ